MHKANGKRRLFRGIRAWVGAASLDEEDSVVRPLFSTFPGGGPGLGLLLLRIAVGVSAIFQGLNCIRGAAWIMGLGEMASGALLVIGFATPLVGAVVAVGAVAEAIARFPLASANPFEVSRVNALIVIVAVAIVLLGPGAVSIDSRLFGRKKIVIPSCR
jgi:uncharacterized membrane protein YphA (DoxX/SURF4 family)